MIGPPDGLRGVIHGKTIELEQAPNLPDGQAVSVIVRPTQNSDDGLRRAFGAWSADADELDRHMAEIYQQRKSDRRWADQ
jgi:hypothetical protein